MTDIYGNLYQFAPNAQEGVDVWGLKNNSPLLQRLEKQGFFKLNGEGNGIMLRNLYLKRLPVLNIRAIIEDITKQLWK